MIERSKGGNEERICEIVKLYTFVPRDTNYDSGSIELS